MNRKHKTVCRSKGEKLKRKGGGSCNNCRTYYLMGTTNIKLYLLRKKMLLLTAIAAPLIADGVNRLYELCREEEVEMDRNHQLIIEILRWPFLE